LSDLSCDSKGGINILVVDDEEVILRTIKHILDDDHFNVYTAMSDTDAFTLVQQQYFDLVISDYNLAGANGIDVILKIKEKSPDFGSILITGYGDDEIVVDAFTRGRVDYYINKPFGTHEVRKVVSIVLKALEARRREAGFKEQLRREVEEATAELMEANFLLEEKERETARLNRRLYEERERLRELNSKLEELSVTDGLTGIYNRRHFAHRLNEEFQRADRYAGTLSLLMLDLDDFKELNDKYGHLVGDEALRQVGGALNKSSRQIDLPARYGGEEFALLLPEVGLDGAARRAERLRKAISELDIHVGEVHAQLKISIGVASYESEKMKEPNDLVRFADEALYSAKSSGKNCVVTAHDNKFEIKSEKV